MDRPAGWGGWVRTGREGAGVGKEAHRGKDIRYIDTEVELISDRLMVVHRLIGFVSLSSIDPPYKVGRIMIS